MKQRIVVHVAEKRIGGALTAISRKEWDIFFIEILDHYYRKKEKVYRLFLEQEVEEEIDVSEWTYGEYWAR